MRLYQQTTAQTYLRLKTTAFDRRSTRIQLVLTIDTTPQKQCRSRITKCAKITVRKNIVLILTRNPASIKSTYRTGRSSDLFRRSRLPSFHQWQRERSLKIPRSQRNGTHSNRHCSGFTPDSLFTFCDVQSLKAPCAMTKICKNLLICIQFPEKYCE